MADPERVLLRGPMYWPVERMDGKRTWIVHVPMGVWSRPATDEEIAEMEERQMPTKPNAEGSHD